MNDSDILDSYRTGMAAYEQLRCAKGVRCHPPTLQSQWEALRAETQEFDAILTLTVPQDVHVSFSDQAFINN